MTRLSDFSTLLNFCSGASQDYDLDTNYLYPRLQGPHATGVLQRMARRSARKVEQEARRVHLRCAAEAAGAEKVCTFPS